MKRRRPLVLALTAALLVVAAPAASARPTTEGASLTAAASIRAPEAWAAGHTGTGVGIALVDTGVSPRPELEGVVGQVDTSGSGRRTDGHGHGTFLAGLMVASEGPDGPLAVAPDAHIVSFKVADAEGNTSIDRLLASLASVRLLADDLGIRVVVLALGGPADDLPDPIETALESLWASGLVVVVASGNDGDRVTEPGVSPYLLTVGATDDAGTADRQDDAVAPWSGRGLGRDGRAKPDVHAPGTSLVSTRVPGSLADREHAGSRIDGRWFRGSGTSMAAAVTAGAAALVLDAEPGLTPDEVKGRLMASAAPGADNPAGTIDVPAALAADGARANGHLPPLSTSPASAPEGDTTPVPITIDLDGWDGASWIGASWIGASWIGASWIGASWIGASWIQLTWDGASWIGASWIDREWAGASWIGASWIGASWIGASWINDNWVGRSWTAASW